MAKNATILNDILEKFAAKGTVQLGSQMAQVTRLPIGSPCIDVALDGGIPCGMATTLVGDPNIGKTTLCTSAAIQAQKRGKKVIWIDTEYKLNIGHAIRLGLDPDMMWVANLSIESSIDFVVEIAKSEGDSIGLVVWDSLAQGMSERMLAKDAETGAMASSESLAYSKNWPRLQNILRIYNIPLLATNQWRTKGIGGTGRTYRDQYGGYTVRYTPAVILFLSNPEQIIRKDIVRGQTVNFKVHKSQVSDPYIEGTFEIAYDSETGEYGVSYAGDLIILASNAGLVKKSGSWYEINLDGIVVKSQGIANFKYDLIKTPNALEKLHSILIPHIEYAF